MLPSNEIAPALIFNPLPQYYEFPDKKNEFRVGSINHLKMPKDKVDLAFYSVRQLAELIKTQQITSLELTKFYLDRLKMYWPK